jgi:polysaccharide pyruvyl transferase WcaK-like protein
MRYVLINDTSSTNNPGCQATVAALQASYRRYDARCVGRVLVGDGYEHFVPFTEFLKQSSQSESPHLLQNAFDDCVDALSDHGLDPFGECEFVVINGEGTMHHDRTGAYLLLGWAALAKQRGLPVAVVNCTIDSFHPFFFRQLNRSVDWLAVREPCSFEFVRPFHPNVRLGADAIFSMPAPIVSDRPLQTNRTRVAYTPGVLSYEGIVSETTVRSHLQSLRQQFDEVEYLSIESEDRAFEPIAAELDCSVHSLGAFCAVDIEAALASFNCLVSGRYHVCIFGLRAGVPVVPLHSNTWKMRGLMRFRYLSPRGAQQCEPLNHDSQLADVAAALTAPARYETPILSPQEFDFEKLSALAESNIACSLVHAQEAAAS